MSRRWNSSFITRQNASIGLKPRVGDASSRCLSLTSAFKTHHTWDPKTTVSDTDHGGVFNFGFSKNGALLGVALERKSVLLFDAHNGKMVARKTDAHTDCVNCVKFLDDRLFATCSDDTTIALWDTRYLKHSVQTFHGHSNWVKNIEYDCNQGVLVTSGFDGCIYTWNINKYSTEDTSSRIFFTSGLMRSKLSPDFSKLIISTNEGYIILIHNLDLSTLSEDLKGFKPNMYRLMQRSNTPLKLGLSFNHVFEQERNRVEFVTDWPAGNEASIISSLQVHPHGWCVVSRNTDATESTEWTCVHDLQALGEVKKTSARPWEVNHITPHTSSSYCRATNTPASSSLAPSRAAHRAVSENRASRSRNESESSDSNNTSINENQAHDINSQSYSSPSNSLRNRTTSGSETDRPSSVSTLYNSTDGVNRLNQDNTNSRESHLSAQISSNTDSARNSQRQEQQNDEQNSEIGNTNSTQSTVNNTNTENASSASNSDSNNTVAQESPANRRATDPETSSVHNSLIQIRRGPRQDDGSFSFSISVHTSSGRTMTFSEHDLESDDDDSFRIERVIPFGSENRENTETNQNVQEPPSGNNNSSLIDNLLPMSSRENERESDANRNVSGEDVLYENEPDLWEEDSDIGNESGHDLVEEEEGEIIGEFEENSDEAETDQPLLEGGVESNRITRQPRTSSRYNVSIERREDVRDQDEEAEHFFWNSGPSRIRRRNRRNEASRRSRNTSASAARSRSRSREDERQADRRSPGSGVAESVNTVGDSQNVRPGSSLDTRPWSNSFMFVLESNSGNRRRRVLNLSYLDTYTESENKLLQKNIHDNKNRLLGFVKECNVGKGFIKEVAFSSDGRLISSPFGYGIRLFAFDSQCNELCDNVPSSPVELYEATCSLAHGNYVVATQFSPVHNLVVSGCLDGKIAFHQPVF